MSSPDPEDWPQGTGHCPDVLVAVGSDGQTLYRVIGQGMVIEHRQQWQAVLLWAQLAVAMGCTFTLPPLHQ